MLSLFLVVVMAYFHSDHHNQYCDVLLLTEFNTAALSFWTSSLCVPTGWIGRTERTA